MVPLKWIGLVGSAVKKKNPTQEVGSGMGVPLAVERSGGWGARLSLFLLSFFFVLAIRVKLERQADLL